MSTEDNTQKAPVEVGGGEEKKIPEYTLSLSGGDEYYVDSVNAARAIIPRINHSATIDYDNSRATYSGDPSSAIKIEEEIRFEQDTDVYNDYLKDKLLRDLSRHLNPNVEIQIEGMEIVIRPKQKTEAVAPEPRPQD